MRIGFGLVLATALSLVLGGGPATAGQTELLKEFVGNVENLNKVGGGSQAGVEAVGGVPLASRFAGSANRIAEGPPPGHSSVEDGCVPADQDPGDDGCFPDYAGDPIDRLINGYDYEACEHPETKDSWRCALSGEYCMKDEDCERAKPCGEGVTNCDADGGLDSGHDGGYGGYGGHRDRCVHREARPITEYIRQYDCQDGPAYDQYASLLEGLQVVQERFFYQGVLGPINGIESPNGYPVVETNGSCLEEVGAGVFGPQADLNWTIAMQSQPISDIQVQICLDVRKCQSEDNFPSSTVDVTDLIHHSPVEFWEPPVQIRVVHHRGNLHIPYQGHGPSRCPCEDRSLVDIVNPTLREVPSPLFPEYPLAGTEQGYGPNGDPENPDLERILEETVAFIGKDCIIKTVKNDGYIFAHDFLTVQLKIPAGTTVRVRAAQDSTALCYIAAKDFGL